MDSNENQINERLNHLGQRMDKIDENIKLLSHIFDEMLKQFEGIKKELKNKK